MARRLVLASHGILASGMKQALELICGERRDVEVLDCYMQSSFDIEAAVKGIMDSQGDDELLVISDMFGGPVNNEFIKHMGRENFYLVAGLNLALVVEITLQLQNTEPLENIILRALRSSKSLICFCNNLSKDGAEEDF